MAACQIVPSVDGLSSGLVAFLDCQAQTLGQRGYLALAASGSSVSLFLTALLTIFVALIGYRMLFGGPLTLREGTFALLKIGAVLAFTSSWPAYQTVIYDVTLRTPANLIAEIGAPTGLPGASGGLPARLDSVDRAFRILSSYGTGMRRADQLAQEDIITPVLFPGFDTFALGASRTAFLAGALGAFALVRLSAGILLALGPLFLTFLLFETTRGLFLGWMRGLIAVILGATVTGLVLAIELALLEPWLMTLIGRRMSGLDITGVPSELLAVAMIFAITLALMLLGGFWLTLAWKLPRWQFFQGLAATGHQFGGAQLEHSLLGSAARPPDNRSRAIVVADSIAALQRREEQALQHAAPPHIGGSTPAAGHRSTASDANRTSYVPIGQSFRARTSSRISAGARARDSRS